MAGQIRCWLRVRKCSVWAADGIHVPFCNNFICEFPVPEAMTELVSDTRFAAATDMDDYCTVAIGPTGLGKAAETAVLASR